MKRWIFLSGFLVALGLAAILWSPHAPQPVVQPVLESPPADFGELLLAEKIAASPMPAVIFVGPRGNVPAGAPTAHGFWSFAQVEPEILSRSGQPLVGEFEWLKTQGWKSVVNLRTDGERLEIGDDAKLPGFLELGLQYLHLPVRDGSPPTLEQAETFLAFVTNPENQPVHVHCRGGIGRAGTMTALYRYAVQGWPMEEAIAESRLFEGGVSSSQEKWLLQWASTNTPGDYGKS